MGALMPTFVAEIKKPLHAPPRRVIWAGDRKMRILCLDIGSKRIGVAASDPLELTAQPVKVIVRRGGKSDFDAIASLAGELEADLILVGLPLDAEGGEGPQAAKVRRFAEKLLEHLRGAGIKAGMEFWDERYSTATAAERLIAADLSRKRRREVVDKMAAAVILEDYLAARESELKGRR